MNAIRRAVRRKQVLRKFWRAFIADECPDEKERIRRERINNIMQNVVLLEAMRRWEIEFWEAVNFSRWPEGQLWRSLVRMLKTALRSFHVFATIGPAEARPHYCDGLYARSPVGGQEIRDWIGVTAQKVVMRVFGILLNAIAVQSVFNGISGSGIFLRSL